MRENRPYGSEGGVGEKPIPTPIRDYEYRRYGREIPGSVLRTAPE
jgi:hypothetical protein